jgi:hypothetical protein
VSCPVHPQFDDDDDDDDDDNNNNNNNNNCSKNVRTIFTLLGIYRFNTKYIRRMPNRELMSVRLSLCIITETT